MRRPVSSHIMHLSRSCRPFNFISRFASTVSFNITISSWLSVLLLFTWEFDCSNGEQGHTDLLACSEEDCLLQQTKPFYALNLTKPSVRWLPGTAVSLFTCPFTQAALCSSLICSVHASPQAITAPHTWQPHASHATCSLVTRIVFHLSASQTFPRVLCVAHQKWTEFLSSTFEKIKT